MRWLCAQVTPANWGTNSSSRQNTRTLVSIEMLGDLLPANGASIVAEGYAIGRVTSSAYGHTLGRPLGLGLVPITSAQPGIEVRVEVEGKSHPARIARRPVYDPENKQIHA